MKRWKVCFGARDGNGYREESLYVSGTSISAAAKNASKKLDEWKANRTITAYMITDVGMMGDPDKEVC
jgi:hypothetical protein